MISSLLRVLNGESLEHPPIWMMRQAGRHLPEYMAVRETTESFIDFCFTPKKAAEVTLQPVTRYDMDAAILFADILLIPIGLGREVRFEKGIGPILEPLELTDIAKLTLSGAADRIDPVYETVSRVRADLATDKALIGFAGAPWTVATYMLEGRGTPTKEKAKRFAYEYPEAMDDLLSALSESTAAYLINQARAGADVLKIFESWAQGLSPALFDRLVIKPTRDIVKRVRAAGIDKPIIGFPRAAGTHVQGFVEATDITALAIGTDMSLRAARSIVGPRVPLQGNLDPLALRIGGDVLKQAVQDVLDHASGSHIFNLGHGVTPDVKIDNVHAVIAHVRGQRPIYV